MIIIFQTLVMLVMSGVVFIELRRLLFAKR